MLRRLLHIDGVIGPPTEIKAHHFIGAFGGRTPDPQVDQQTGDDGDIHLDGDPVGPIA